MKRTDFKQLNTPELWDGYYTPEEINKFHRILDTRRAWILEAISQWGGSIEQILDIGCGWGELFDFLRENDFKFKGTGVDICPNTIKRQQENKPADIWILSNAEKLPLKETFDVVFCGETIEHLDNPREALKEIRRVTKPGGLMMITVPLDNFNNAFEHTWYISRKDVCTWFNNATLLNYKLLDSGGVQCAAFANYRKKVKWPEYDSIYLRSK